MVQGKWEKAFEEALGGEIHWIKQLRRGDEGLLVPGQKPLETCRAERSTHVRSERPGSLA